MDSATSSATLLRWSPKNIACIRLTKSDRVLHTPVQYALAALRFVLTVAYATRGGDNVIRVFIYYWVKQQVGQWHVATAQLCYL